MPQQLDLMGRPELRVQPAAGRAEPRLWVRRLVVWSEPGVTIREVILRPGLNIVWSPDPADRDTEGKAADAIGHGGGKTLFCRLLRYCLGEDRFAPEGQRDRIVSAFIHGMVGAEVLLDGTPWAIVRSIGIRRRHVAVPEEDLDAVASGEAVFAGMEPFLNAVQSQLLSDEITRLMPGGPPRRAWLTALAWLARDQECRFDHVLDWRSASSESDSPVRARSRTDTLDALRALLGAIEPAEHALRSEINRLEGMRSRAEQEARHHEWQARQTRSGLVAALALIESELPPGRLAVEPIRKAARAALARAARVEPGAEVPDLNVLRADSDKARSHAERLATDLAKVEARIPEIERLVSLIRGELPSLSFAAHESEHPLCPVCEVPIDRALAKGCKLSHKLPDLEAARERWAKRQMDLKQERQRLREHQQERARLSAELEAARMASEELRRRVEVVERARDAREGTWYTARRLVDDANRLDELFVKQEEATSEVERCTAEIGKKRELAEAYRRAQVQVFQRTTEIFDAIIRELVGPEAAGHVALTGSGLELSVQMGGERSTAAIDSLKVLAFDLAALCMSIEGITHVPAFLVHDSPREADLGLTAYHRLFQLARSLEEVGDNPLFQYIVTTTTRPPAELCKEPWLRLTLYGAPAEARLLRRDL